MRKKNNLADRFTSNRTPQEETLNPGVSSVKEEQFSEENLEMEELVQAHKEEVRTAFLKNHERNPDRRFRLFVFPDLWGFCDRLPLYR